MAKRSTAVSRFTNFRMRELVRSKTGCAIIGPPFPLRDFTVSLHRSKWFEADPGNRWMRDRIVELFEE